ncbi:MAG: hypothetical protein AB1773_06505 [Pseudomonadota bacterium]
MASHGRQEKFVVMLSSGQRPRYRDDIIRVMALPTGGRTQFRYRKQHVPDDLFRELSNNGLRESEALVAYLDTSNKDRAPEIVPCRFCRIVDSEGEGEFVVIRFEVGDFAMVDKDANVQSAVTEALLNGASLPKWEDGKLGGHFLVALKNRPDGCRSDQDRRAWQAVVGILGGRADFRDCPFFYNLRSVVAEDAKTPVPFCEDKYALEPDKIYRADVVHYAPPTVAGQQGGPWGQLKVSAQGNGVQSLTTQPLAIDSPYDIKRVYFRTTGEARKQYALLSFGRRLTQSCPGQETEHHDFELVLEVAGAWRRQTLVGVLIAAFLAAPRWVDMLRAEAWDWSSAAVALFTALVTAGLVVFGLRKVP